MIAPTRPLTLAVSLCLAIAATASTGRAQFVPGGPGMPRAWGPSWVGGGPPGGFPRPEHFKRAETAVAVSDDDSRLGASVRMWADAEVEAGHKYALIYQVRIHTGAGKFGPILATPERPEGVAFEVASGVADASWNGLEGEIDVTRRAFDAVTNLPRRRGLVVLRIEPQLHDATAKKFLTPSKTSAMILVASVGDDGKIQGLTSLRKWVAAADGVDDVERVISLLSDLDDYSFTANGAGDALAVVLKVKGVPAEMKSRLIRVIPRGAADPKASYALFGTLKGLSAGDDVALKDAAAAKLADR